ncbi:MAG TPA: amidohydrolase family protein [Gemmatimonadaceae bacterium]
MKIQKGHLTTLMLASAAILPLCALHAQLGSTNPPAGPRGVYAITHAKIVPVTGPEIANGTLVIGADGRIQAVGANVPIPTGAKVIDATGLSVYPGMMDGGTSMGLSEIGQGAESTVDVTEVGSFNPNVQAFFGINPHSAHVGVTRVVGVTHVVSSPKGGILSGQAALINLSGSTPPEMVLIQKVAMAISLPGAFGGGRGFGRGGFAAAGASANSDASRLRTRQIDSLRTMLHDAEAYAKAFDAYAKDKSLPRPKSDVVLASLVPVIQGKMYAMFTAERAADIRDAVSFAEEFHMKPIIVGGAEALKVAPFLKQHDVPVLITGVRQLPRLEDDAPDVNYSLPGKLVAAGVRIAITSGDGGPMVRDLPSVAGMAAAFGLSKTDALKSVTIWPAQIFGVGDKLGSLEAGKLANVVVTTGDILEARTDTKYLFIDGRPVPLDTRHTELYMQFKDRP